jgi:hypothetical protein
MMPGCLNLEDIIRWRFYAPVYMIYINIYFVSMCMIVLWCHVHGILLLLLLPKYICIYIISLLNNITCIVIIQYIHTYINDIINHNHVNCDFNNMMSHVYKFIVKVNCYSHDVTKIVCIESHEFSIYINDRVHDMWLIL